MSTTRPTSIQHAIVYRDGRYFSGWPFNGGFWQFSDGELAVGFVRGEVDYADPQTLRHKHVDCGRGEHVILRSTDGGLTWPTADMVTVYKRPEWDEKTRNLTPSDPRRCEKHDPRADGYCLISGYGIPTEDAPHVAFTTVSTDRGRTWGDPVLLPALGQFRYLGGRPSYVIREDGLLLLTIHGKRADETEGQSFPIVFASEDGGGSWRLLAEIKQSPPCIMGIMPDPVILQDGRILVAVRRQYDGANAYTEIYASGDGGRTWAFLSRANDWGAPANLTELGDGRLVCTYGYRQFPYGIRATVSENGGRTWGNEIVLRDDGGSGDLGYPRTLLRPDGKLITVYYFHSKVDAAKKCGRVRHIAATVWEV